MSPGERPHADPGLQPERTSLAWTRTGLSLAFTSAVFIHWAPRYGATVWIMVAISLLAAALVGSTRGRRYAHSVRGIVQERAEPQVLPVFLLGATSALLGVIGLVVIVGGTR